MHRGQLFDDRGLPVLGQAFEDFGGERVVQVGDDEGDELRAFVGEEGQEGLGRIVAQRTHGRRGVAAIRRGRFPVAEIEAVGERFLFALDLPDFRAEVAEFSGQGSAQRGDVGRDSRDGESETIIGARARYRFRRLGRARVAEFDRFASS